MLRFKTTYIFLILVAGIVGCKQTKHVPDGKYLLKKNEIVQSGDNLDKYDLEDIIRQQPNYRRFGVKWKLMAFNMVDSAKVADKRIKKNIELRETNKKRLARQDKINSRRMDKAVKKGKEYYTEKIVSLKDTLDPRMFFREWYKYKIGRPPVIFDSLPYNKSLEQLGAYLQSKGYFYGNVSGVVKYKENKKCVVNYLIETGKPYIIDSVYIVADNPLVKERYDQFLKRRDEHPLEGKKFDKDLLDDHRYEVAKHMRNSALFGFSQNNISFLADTNKSNLTVTLGVIFGDRKIKPINVDTLITVPHELTHVSMVYFHLADTIRYKGNFAADMAERGLSIYDGQFLRTVDTLMYTKIRDKKTGAVDASRVAVLLYNGDNVVRPKILEAQNYLEVDGPYSEEKLERTYMSLLQMNLFDAVKTEMHEIGNGCVDAHYYLTPSKKQTFRFEPTFTNSNGYLGFAASINYVNRNLFRGGEKLTMSLSGGFESNPPVFDQYVDGSDNNSAAQSFNTFEIGPSTSLDLPGLFPFRLSNIAKQLRPKTVISAAYNFQQRNEFTRSSLQLNYLWHFYSKRTMLFRSGFPGLSVIRFVNIDNKPIFESKLHEINDLFLLNAYSNQFIWQDWKFTFEYNIKNKEHRKGNSQVYFRSSFDPAGNLFALFQKYQDTLDNGEYAIQGVAYAQFARLDNEFIFSKPFGKEQSLNIRFAIGAGLPYGNSPNSLPYDYSFFGGGANDNRGWRARSLGPGSYKYYIDTNRAATQIGDMRLGTSVEYRFDFNKLIEGALFVDAGNVWTSKEDVNRPGAKISGSWYKEIAVAFGFGLRFDLEYFIIRADMGIPIYNPAMPVGSRFITDDRDNYYNEGKAIFFDDYDKYLPKPFTPKLHFGIGYPF